MDCGALHVQQVTDNIRGHTGIRSPSPTASGTALSSQSNWQTFFSARRRPSISLSGIRLLAVKSGTMTVVEITTSKSYARRYRRQIRRSWLRRLRSLPMRMISQICGANSSKQSSLAAHLRQSVVFAPSTRVADGDRRLRYRALLVEIRYRALNQKVSLQRDTISPHHCVHPGVHTLGFQCTFSLADKHLPLVAAELSAMVTVSTCCTWLSPRQNINLIVAP
jgi:hypothetical protein